MKTKIILTLFLFLTIPGITSAQNWRDIQSVEDVCNAYPDEMEMMLKRFNLDFPGLEKVKKSVETGNLTEACNQLLAYYQKSQNALHLRKDTPPPSEKTIAIADTILENVFVIQNVRGKVPWEEDGHRNWHYKGPNNDREWAWLSNRHSQLNDVYDAYLETGNPKYAIYVDEFLRDFIIKSMPYPGVKSSTSVWRGLEVSFRSKVWSRIFYGLLNSEYLLPSTRLLMLSSIPDHAHYNRHFHGGNNWLTMEISALATVATNFPEYNDAEEWLNYSIDTMVKSMKDQVYPDGVQTELTSHYHNVSLNNFEQFMEICDRANKPLPPFFNRTIKDMYAYIAHAVRPDGNRILNNDGDLGSDRALILKGAKTYDKPDWEYIVTNGKSGINPTDGPSYLFPWAGQLISRSGFDADAHWSFFDIGPWGSGHQHNDKLHLSVSAYGRDLLVDAGRFAYTGEVADRFRPYARGSQGHNILLFDRKGQGAGPLLAEVPLSEEQWEITDAYDYAKGSFDAFPGLEGKLKHTRHLYYSRDDFWIVVDEIETDRPRKVDALWHWHPACKVAVDGNRVYTENDRGNLQIVPISNQEWEITFIKGQEEPEIQGWYSKEYNEFEPNVASIYTTQIKSDSNLVWLLFPSEKVEKGTRATIISELPNAIMVQVTNEKGYKKIVTVPL
jgi:hypothetical protein